MVFEIPTKVGASPLNLSQSTYKKYERGIV